jgi:hypothetical protein
MGAKQASNRASEPKTLGKTRMKAGGNGLSLRHPDTAKSGYLEAGSMSRNMTDMQKSARKCGKRAILTNRITIMLNRADF